MIRTALLLAAFSATFPVAAGNSASPEQPKRMLSSAALEMARKEMNRSRQQVQKPNTPYTGASAYRPPSFDPALKEEQRKLEMERFRNSQFGSVHVCYKGDRRIVSSQPCSALQ